MSKGWWNGLPFPTVTIPHCYSATHTKLSVHCLRLREKGKIDNLEWNHCTRRWRGVVAVSLPTPLSTTEMEVSAFCCSQCIWGQRKGTCWIVNEFQAKRWPARQGCPAPWGILRAGGSIFSPTDTESQFSPLVVAKSSLNFQF